MISLFARPRDRRSAGPVAILKPALGDVDVVSPPVPFAGQARSGTQWRRSVRQQRGRCQIGNATPDLAGDAGRKPATHLPLNCIGERPRQKVGPEPGRSGSTMNPFPLRSKWLWPHCRDGNELLSEVHDQAVLAML